MIRSLVLLVVLVAGCYGSALPVSRRVANPFAIEGILDCGSKSDVVDTHFDGCDAVPCEAHIGRVYHVQVEFRPHESHDRLRFAIILIQAGEQHEVIDVDVPDSEVEAGVSYQFGYDVHITGAFLDDALMLFNLEGNRNEQVICLGITLRVIRP